MLSHIADVVNLSLEITQLIVVLKLTQNQSMPKLQ